jgi:basic membrane protein A
MSRRRALSTAAAAGAIAGVGVVAGVGGYFVGGSGGRVTVPGPATTLTNTVTVSTGPAVTTTVTAPPVTQTQTVTQTIGGGAFKVAVVSDIGGRGDLSFNDMGFKGLDEASRDLGAIPTELVSRTEADYIPNLETAARDPDVKLVVAVGFLLTDAIKDVSARFPDTNFAIIDGFAPGLPNVLSILYQEHKGSALVGALGALVAAHHGFPHIGAVLGIEIPVLWKFEIGYKWGADWALKWYEQEFGKTAPVIGDTPAKERVLWTYTGTFSDITKGFEAAKPMYEQGAVTVYNIGGPLGLGINQAVQEIATRDNLQQGPPFWTGVDANQDWVNPGFVIASMMKRVDRGVYFASLLTLANRFRSVVADGGGIATLGIGTTVGGTPIEGISMSTLADLDEFIQMGVRAEELTGRPVLPAAPEEIRAKVAAMRAAQPDWIWNAVSELQQGIQSGPIEVPEVFTREEIDRWRGILG